MADEGAVQTLTRAECLRCRPDFLSIQRHGLRARGRYMTLVCRASVHGISRLGIVAPRRLGNAVQRNRMKRRVRELFRRYKPSLALDVVVLPRPELGAVPFSFLQEDYCRVLRRQLRAIARHHDIPAC